MSDVIDLVLSPMEEDVAVDGDDVVVKKLKENAKKRKGRGFAPDKPERESLKNFEGIPGTDKDLPRGVDGDAQRSADGWILMVTGIHEEAHEDDVHGLFSDFGGIKSLHLNLDRRTGFLKGYALIEYEHFKQALSAKNELDGTDLLGNRIQVDWTFMKNPLSGHRSSSSK